MPGISGNYNKMARFITAMTKADAMRPVIALESTVVAGRTYQAYKRGKGEEARERFLEETTGSVVWLGGVKSFNALGDKAIQKILKKPGATFDVGTDKILRTPFDNFMSKAAPKGFSANKIALMKGAKVLASVGLANFIIGFAVPKINHAITNIMRGEKAQKNISTTEQAAKTENNKNENISFKGGLQALNVFTNAIENTNTGKLLSTDVGTVSGRMYNARTKEERREIAFRDIASIYFYMWAQGHVGNVINFATTGKMSRLNPASAIAVTDYLDKFLKDNGGEMSVEDFRKAVIGDTSKVNLPKDITFETEELSKLSKFFKKEPLEVIKVSELESKISDADLLNRIKKMAALQPNRGKDAVITKQQLIDVFNNAKITDSELLDKVFTEFTEGAHKDDFRFVSNSKLENLKKEMIDYAETICKEAKDGKVNSDLLTKIKNRNLKFNTINFVAGFVVAAAFLSTFIPKIQYYLTRKTTGVDAFPGTYEYQKENKS